MKIDHPLIDTPVSTPDIDDNYRFTPLEHKTATTNNETKEIFSSSNEDDDEDWSPPLESSSDEELCQFLQTLDTGVEGDELLEDESSVEDEDIDRILLNATDVSEIPRRRKKRKRRKTEYTTEASPKKTKRRTAATATQLTPELEKLLQEANDLYIAGDFDLAIPKLEDLVRRAPGLHDPFHLLGLIYEQRKDKKKAMEFYLVAAHLVPGDNKLWARIGQMSHAMGNISQAIYCYRKALRQTASSKETNQIRYELAMCNKEKANFSVASKLLSKIFEENSNDAFIGRELALCYEQEGNFSGAAQILETCINIESASRHPPHTATLNQLCGVYLQLERNIECRELILKYFAASPLEITPIDILSKLAAAFVRCGQYDDPNVRATLKLLRAKANEGSLDSCLELAEAFYKLEEFEEALAYFIAAVTPVEKYRDSGVLVRTTRCYLKLNRSTDAASFLKRCLASEEAAGAFKMEVGRSRLTLAYLLADLGSPKDADDALASLSSQTIVEMDLPPAMPKSQRELLLSTIEREYRDLSVRYPIPSESEMPFLLEWQVSFELAADSNSAWSAWTISFTSLVRDSELDLQRILQHAFKKRVENSSRRDKFTDDKSLLDVGPRMRRSTDRVAVNRARARGELGLTPLIELMGWESYGDLLYRGLYVMRLLGNHREAVALVDSILYNLKFQRLQLYQPEKRKFRNRLRRVCLQLAVEGGLFRMALPAIRIQYLKNPESSDRVLQAFSRLLFCGVFAHNAMQTLAGNLEREVLLENRSWAIRQLLHRPLSYPLTMIVGHFCLLSGRWVFAIAEYSRAYSLRPNDALASLCLGVSYLNFSITRSIRERHAVVLRAFAVMCQYRNVRREAKMAEAFRLVGDGYVERCLECASKDSEIGHLFTNVWIRQLQTSSAEVLGARWVSSVRKSIENVLEAEITYNFARSFHHLGLVHLAAPLYTECIESLDTFNVHNQVRGLDPQLSTDESHSILWYMFGVPPPCRFKCQTVVDSTCCPRDLLATDAQQIRFLASINYAHILRSAGSVHASSEFLRREVVFAD